MKELNLSRMPSRQEIVNVKHNNILTSAIAKNGGFKKWAEMLSLEMKNSESKTGWIAEDWAKDYLESLGYKVEKMSTKHPYDLLIDNFIKVDVKCSKPIMVKKNKTYSRLHSFWINKRHSTCDLYLLYALDEENKIERVFVIPGHELMVKTLCIGKETKYEKYIDRWDYFDKYIKFHEQLLYSKAKG